MKKDKWIELIIDTYAEPMSKFKMTQIVVKGEPELISPLRRKLRSAEITNNEHLAPILGE